MAEGLQNEGFNTVALTGTNNLGERIKAFNDLQNENNSLEIICTVDILSEGVVIIKNAILKIIDDETFNKAQEIKYKNMIHFVRTSSVDRFNNVYCAHCGCKLHFMAPQNTETHKRPGHYECLKCKEMHIQLEIIH